MRLRLPRRRERSLGIRLRISTPNGVVVDTDSVDLHCIARFSGAAEGSWYKLIAGSMDGYVPCPAEEFSTVPVKIEIMPVKLDARPLQP